MIIFFKDFVNEARLSDISFLFGDEKNDIFNKLKGDINKDFSIDKNLIKYITLKNRIKNNKIRFTIEYYDIVSHDIKVKIKERTSLKCVDEFNDLIEYSINFLFPDKLDDLTHNGKYGIYFIEYDTTLIYLFNIDEYLKNDYKIKLITIMPGYVNNNLLKTFIIEKNVLSL